MTREKRRAEWLMVSLALDALELALEDDDRDHLLLKKAIEYLTERKVLLDTLNQ